MDDREYQDRVDELFNDIEDQIDELEKDIDAFRKKIRRESIRRMKDDESVRIEMICISVLSGMERVADHALTITKALSRVD